MGNLITLPFAALLRWMYSITGSYGVAIILFSLILKLILLPFQMKSKRSMVRMGKLNDKLQELQKQYAKNQQKYQEEVAKLYQEEGVNPASGCLWSFLPLFVIIPLYQIIYRPITHFMGLSNEAMEAVRTAATALGYDAGAGNAAYEQIALTEFVSSHWEGLKDTAEGLINVNFNFLGIDLSATPGNVFGSFTFSVAAIGLVLIPVLAAATQFLTTTITMKSNGQTQQQGSMKMMNLLMPLFSLWWCFNMPAAMGVYWIANSVFIMIQEGLLGRYFTKKINAEEEERAAKRESARQLRMEEAKRRAAEQREQEPKKLKKQTPPKSGEKKPSTTEAGRVGDRPYARGRSYREDRYDEKE